MNTFKTDVKIDAKIFRRFAFFNVFIKQGHIKPPIIFASLMIVFAVIIFIFRAKSDQAMLLFYLLLSIGLLLPIVYIFSFLRSVNLQIKRMKLSTPKYAYSLHLNGEKLELSANSEKKTHFWNDIDAVFKNKGCIYIYVSPNQAYLLPTSQLDENDLLNMLKRVVPASALHF